MLSLLKSKIKISFFYDENLAKIALSIKIVWKIISEGVNQ